MRLRKNIIKKYIVNEFKERLIQTKKYVTKISW